MYPVTFRAQDPYGAAAFLTVDIEVVIWTRGDANMDGYLLGSDVIYLVNYFKGINPRPTPTGRGDANGDGLIIGSDLVVLVNFFNGTGPHPPPPPTPPPGPGSTSIRISNQDGNQ